MAKWGSVDYRQLKRLQEKIDKLAEKDHEQFCIETIKELAARMLAKVIKKTPVGDYSHEIEVTAKRDSKNHKKGEVYKKRVNTSGKNGGTLRRGWTASSEKEAMYGVLFKGEQTQVDEYVNLLNVTKDGKKYIIEIVNPVSYASYVNNGHRTRDHKGWVPGRFFLEISEQELEREAPKIIENKLEKYLRSVFNE